MHHESEEYADIAKLIAHKKVETYKQFVITVKDSIPIKRIEHIVKNAVLRALSKEKITEICFEAIIEESGNIDSDPYYCRSSSTVKRLKKELMKKTLQSVSDYLGLDICKEMQRYIVTDIKSKFDFVLDPFTKFLGISKLTLIQSILAGLAAFFIGPYVSVIVGAATMVGTFIIAINVNSRSWRSNVASEIYEKVSKNRDEVVKEVTSNVMERCKITTNNLDRIALQLDNFTSQLAVLRFGKYIYVIVLRVCYVILSLLKTFLVKSYQTKRKVFWEKGATSRTEDQIHFYNSNFPEKFINNNKIIEN